jgi:hypothetical protein
MKTGLRLPWFWVLVAAWATVLLIAWATNTGLIS